MGYFSTNGSVKVHYYLHAGPNISLSNQHYLSYKGIIKKVLNVWM